MEPVIQLDRARRLKYTSRALRLVEERSGHLLGELLISHASVGSVAWLMWGALLHEDVAFTERREPELTIDDVCDLLDEHWFAKGKPLKDLVPFFTEAVVEAGFFTRGKDSPETEPGSSGSGKPDSGTSVSVPGSPE